MTHFDILVPFYNPGEFLKGTIESLLDLDYEDYTVWLLDDNSDDDSWKVYSKYYLEEPNVNVTFFSENRGPLATLVRGIEFLPLNTVCVQVDGDGDTIRKDTLRIFDGFFSDSNIWVAGGNITRQQGKPYDYPRYTSFSRRDGWCYSHPRAWRKWFFKKVPHKELIDAELGDYWRYANDCAYFWPMLEMAGPDRIAITDEILYYHNVQNPLNMFRTPWVRKERDGFVAYHQSKRPFCRLKAPTSPPRRRPQKTVWTEKKTGEDGKKFEVYVKVE